MPVQLQRAMAAEAEAAREARAKVIAAEGEQKASRALKEAAEVIAESPAALQVNNQPFKNPVWIFKKTIVLNISSCATSRRSTPSRLKRIQPSFSHCRLIF